MVSCSVKYEKYERINRWPKRICILTFPKTGGKIIPLFLYIFFKKYIQYTPFRVTFKEVTFVFCSIWRVYISNSNMRNDKNYSKAKLLIKKYCPICGIL